MQNRKGFTLVELSIVLVIIGLLVGGVLQGKELIDAAKRQSIITELTQYQTALNTFRLQYDGTPGDFDEAAEYWPGESISGDGNGIVGSSTESIQVWNHLILAEITSGEFINSSYGGVESNFGDNTIWTLRSSSLSYWGKTRNTNFLFFGITSAGNTDHAALSPQNSKRIDSKIDDGNATLGRMVSMNGWVGTVSGGDEGCTTAGNGNTPYDFLGASGSENYKLQNDQIACRFFYYFD